MKTANQYVDARIRSTLAKTGVELFKGETVHAYVNHGRWVADCPCNGSELVAPRRLMVCGSCGAEHKVVFPPEAEAIEQALDVRPQANQNWTVGQTVDELVAENIDNGIFPEGF